MPREAAAEKLKVFISYSRADEAFADELFSALEILGFDPSLDRHSIREGEDWQTRLGNLIAASGTVVFVLSPDSARSKMCAWEVEKAAELSKRILPVLARGLNERPLGRQPDGSPWPDGIVSPPPRLGAINYTRLRFDAHEDGRPRSFMAAARALGKALETDLDWLNEHARLLGRALEWDRGGRPVNRLMSRADIAEARAWEKKRAETAPELTDLHRDYIKASEDEEARKADSARKEIAERERLAAEREDAARKAEEAAKRAEEAARAVTAERERSAGAERRNRRLFGALAVLGVLMLIAAVWQSRETEKREQLIYTSLAAKAMEDDRHDRAMRFALQAHTPPGALPWSPFSTALEGRLAGAATLTRLQHTLNGHSGAVTVAAFSPDGKRVVTGSHDNTARLWDAETGAEIRAAEGGGPIVLKAHTDDVYAATFSLDAKRVVTGSEDKTARLWDAESGAEIAVLKAHTSDVNAASFSPDGKRVVTGSKDKTARLWDAESGAEIAVLKAHTGPVWAASFSPDGKRVVTGSYDNTARLWDAEKGAEIAVLKAHIDQVRAASFSPDGKRVVTGSDDNTARLWDAETAAEIAVLKAHTGPVWAASFSPDGKRVVTGSYDNTARLWDAETGAEIAFLKTHTDAVWAASFSPDGKRVVTGSVDNTAIIWDVRLMTVYGVALRATVCATKLNGHDAFTAQELADPILAGIDPDDPVARNPCLRRGPLHWEYYTQAFDRWTRWGQKRWAAFTPSSATPETPPAP